MLIIGIDPGLSGAVALYNTETGALVVEDIPTLALTRGGKAKRDVNVPELARIIDAAQPDRAFIEAVSSMPGQGVSSVFKFGEVLGIIRGCLAFVPTASVPPAVWKRAMGIPSGSGKDASRALATNLFPRHSSLFARVKDDGRAEAALLAVYGARKIEKENAA
jgi:crossover junction endodeoxyribonuclease RuvC